MKLFSNLVLIVLAISLNSCCKNTGYPIAEIDVEYLSYHRNSEVWVVRTDKNDFDNVIDTVRLMGESTNLYINDVKQYYKIRLLLDLETYNHILIPIDRNRIDTISQVTVFYDKCEDVESIGYYWNGVYTTDLYKEAKH